MGDGGFIGDVYSRNVRNGVDDLGDSNVYDGGDVDDDGGDVCGEGGDIDENHVSR